MSSKHLSCDWLCMHTVTTFDDPFQVRVLCCCEILLLWKVIAQLHSTVKNRNGEILTLYYVCAKIMMLYPSLYVCAQKFPDLWYMKSTDGEKGNQLCRLDMMPSVWNPECKDFSVVLVDMKIMCLLLVSWTAIFSVYKYTRYHSTRFLVISSVD